MTLATPTFAQTTHNITDGANLSAAGSSWLPTLNGDIWNLEGSAFASAAITLPTTFTRPGLTINGAAGGSTITLNDGAGHYGRFVSTPSVYVNVGGGDLTFTGGNASGNNNGGAFSVNALLLTGLAGNTGNLTFSNNTANTGGAIFEGLSWLGDAILISGDYGSILFDNNTATQSNPTKPAGGAISANTGSLTINANVTDALAFTNNKTNGGTGGAIVGYGKGYVNITGTYGSILFANNSAGVGGGISTDGTVKFDTTTTGKLTANNNSATGNTGYGGGFITGSSGVSILGSYGGGIEITNNTARGSGGAIQVMGSASGILIKATTPTITFSNNATTGATSQGGALYSNRGFQLDLGQNTILTATNNSAGGLSGSGNDANGGFLYVAGGSMVFNIAFGAVATIGDANSITTHTDSIAAAATIPLTKTGAGTLILNANNTYAGGTLINGGTVQVSSNNNLGAASGTLSFNNSTLHTTGSFTANRTTTLNSGGGTFDADAATTLTMEGVIGGVGALTKTGTGTLILTGENTYTGTTSNATGSTLQIGNGSATGSLTSSSIANAGTLIFNRSTDSAYSGLLSGAGDLRKEGAGVLTLNANGSGTSQQKSVDVQGGTLCFTQDNGIPTTPTPFTTTGDYTTRSNAVTELGANNSVLDIGGQFIQEANSALKVQLGAWTNGSRADIRVNGNVSLAGTLEVTGFTAGLTPNRSSVLTDPLRGYKLIETTTGTISSYYQDSNLIGAGNTGLDYLSISSELRNSSTELWLGFVLNWNGGGVQDGTGTFTMDTGSFTVDTRLEDQIGPFASLWDGKTLTKKGDGILRLAEQNTYTGKTIVDGGTLQAFSGTDNVFQRSSDIIVNAGATLDINGTHQLAQRLSSETATGGTITLNGGSLTADNSTGDSIFSGDIKDGNTTGGTLIKTGSGELTLSGKTLWTGDTHIETGTLTLDGIQGQDHANLTSNVIGQSGAKLQLIRGATLTGWVDPLDMTIDSTSTWNMTGNSLVNNLALAGTLTIAPPNAGTFKTLTVEGNYTGDDGLIVFNGALADDASPVDKLVVQGNTSGTTRVAVNNVGGTGAATLNGIKLIEVQGQSDGTFTQQGRIVAGAYDYTLARGIEASSANNWYLTSKLSSGPDRRRPEGGSYATNMAAAGNLFTMRWDDHNRREGYVDTETGQQKLSSLWLRAEGGRTRQRDNSNQLKTKSNRTVFQLGSDIYQWENGSHGEGKTIVGIMGGYGNQRNTTRAPLSGHTSIGKVDGYHVGAYGSWQADAHANQGWYVDSWAYYSWLDNSVSGSGLATESYTAKGLTASVEAGYTLKLTPNNNQTGYYLQPQAQLIWMGTKADSHRERNGTRIQMEGEDNLQSRVGLKAFTKTESGATPFAETNWIHNSKLAGANLDGVRVKQSGNRNLGELRAGIEGKVNKQVSVLGKLGHQIGSQNYRDTSLTFELKAEF